MSYRKFLKICKQEFGFLEKEFQFKVTKPLNGGLYYEYSLLNATTGIKVEYELRENQLFLMVCRLQEGIFPPPVGEMRPDSIVNCFDLADLAVVRDQETPTLLPVGQVTSAITLEKAIANLANLLLAKGEDVLLGDFAILSELELIVKERARVSALKKWGDRAHEFGWEVT